jgi:hypothetical protein
MSIGTEEIETGEEEKSIIGWSYSLDHPIKYFLFYIYRDSLKK